MSAINEWFGAYNMIFRHIKNNFGDRELDDYLNYLSDKAYEDVSESYKENGLEMVKGRYTGNFKRDGGTVISSIKDNVLSIGIELCPSYKYMLASDNPYDRPEPYYCACCIKLNKRILHNSGFDLDVTECNKNGSCCWTVVKKG